jgi:hypothetical protein
MRGTIGKLTAESGEVLVRTVLKADLSRRLTAAFAAGPRTLSDRYHTWCDKYAISLPALETARDGSATRVRAYLKGLGYE